MGAVRKKRIGGEKTRRAMPGEEKEETPPFRPAPYFHLPLRASAGYVLREMICSLSSEKEREEAPPQKEVVAMGGQECRLL